jgi:chemotaxis protein histidine kinase CheA/ActR/RegA family two-component response regulator
MEPEQLKKITGYFIEEAREHLETINQGLQDLAKTIADSEAIHECYRAAHSIKGGAAMLALESIRRTAHRMEDYFKYLKENPARPDQYMETSFGKLKYALQTQVDRLEQNPDLTLTEAEASDLMAEIEPIFTVMPAHLEKLAHGTTAAPTPEPTLKPNFAPDALSKLRELLQLFKQPDSPSNRSQALEHAQGLTALGEQANLPTWVSLMQAATAAIDNPENTPKILTSQVIKEIKQAYDLVIANRAAEIVPSSQLLALAPPAPVKVTKPKAAKSSPTPEVGMAELNSLASLFDQESPEMAASWQEIIPTGEEFNGDDFQLFGGDSDQNLDELFSGLDDEEDLDDGSYSSEDMSFLMAESPQLAAAKPAEPVDNFFDELMGETSDAGDFLNLEGDLDAEAGDLDIELSFDDMFSVDRPSETASVRPQDINNNSTDNDSDLLFADLGLGGIEDNLLDQASRLDSDEYDALNDIFGDSGDVGADPFNLGGVTESLVGDDLEDISLETENFDDLFSSEISPESDWEGLDLFADEPSPEATLDDFFGSDDPLVSPSQERDTFTGQGYSSQDFDELETMLGSGAIPQGRGYANESTVEQGAFEELEAMLDTSTGRDNFADFADLDALLEPATPPKATPKAAATPAKPPAKAFSKDGFEELEGMLEETEKAMGGGSRKAESAGRPPAVVRPQARGVGEQTMRVPVKQLDNLNNLMGELVVNRNTLEQDQGRLREFLDNLMRHIQQLTDVGGRMQDLYERSLLESSLLASRQKNNPTSHHPASIHNTHHGANNAAGEDYDPLEMDRFTGFHLLSQEMIELIVRVKESASDIEFLVQGTDQVARMLRQITDKLQEGLNRSRMMPFKQTADRLPRAVRDICVKLQKDAELKVEGQDTLVDKMILEQLYDPMTHLVNNAMTHGIETPEVRAKAGKNPKGKIQIKAFHQGNQTVISVSDDGAGIDPERIRQKVIEKGLVSASEAQKLSKIDLYDFLFHAGFSTKDQADELAGRGVGMDVVRTKLNEIRGTVGTDSTLGKGTTFTIRLPLTLSIGKALKCLSDHSTIAFPIDGVEQPIDVPIDSLEVNENGRSVYQLHNEKLEVYPLHELLTFNRHITRGNLYGGQREDGMISIVILRGAGNYLAVQVDQVMGELEIVTKQLEGPAPKPMGIAGATVLGDGKIMPIVDVLELIDISLGRLSKDKGGMLWDQGNITVVEPTPVKTEPLVLIVDDSITVRELLSMTFTKSGYRVEQARDGQEAWDKMRSGLPCDIVFCDIEMPKMDGLELLDRMHKDEVLSKLPIAMLTSRGADRHRQIAAERGARGYFTKPYLEDVLLDAAQRMIKGEVLLHVNAPA